MDSFISLLKVTKSLPSHLSHQFFVTTELGSVQPRSTSNSEHKTIINPDYVALPSKSKKKKKSKTIHYFYFLPYFFPHGVAIWKRGKFPQKPITRIQETENLPPRTTKVLQGYKMPEEYINYYLR